MEKHQDKQLLKNLKIPKNVMRFNNPAQRIIPSKYLVVDSSLIYLFSARPRLF